ncbi:hypothetical protein DFH07DRAFT_872212 [Mycena maculata]|uniref:SnoaL-like domain-containing protein n=1 Tax=Mycena maculata TaxID=230809 RepID=A0AAD7MK03_9AGAR|nr:hypothetical protein DFH07DRAFT_872212 [Mycena maculata]
MSLSHHRSPSSASNSEPSQTHHHSLLPAAVPTTALVESVAGAAHYSGSHVEPPPTKHRHSSHDAEAHSHTAVKGDHKRVLEDLRALYECRPTAEIFERSWHPDAVFEDPFALAKGFREYAAQWYAMPKLFAKSETLSERVMSSTREPNRLVFAQTQRYKNRFVNRTVKSVVTVDLDERDRIIRLVDQWDGKPLGGAWWRRVSGKVAPLFVSVPNS